MIAFHPSHSVESFNDYSPEADERFCANCGVCECHSYANCIQPCPGEPTSPDARPENS